MRKMNCRPSFLALTIALSMVFQFLSGCVSLVYYEGDYHGKVIDADTREPIMGAVVLGVWSLEYGTAGGPVHEYYDARETVTDENGEFTIKGMGPRAVTHLEKMKIVIFKAGYEDVGLTPWDTLKTADYYKDRVRWEGDMAIISLQKLSLEQQKKRLGVRILWVPLNKQVLLTDEINREKKEIKNLEDR